MLCCLFFVQMVSCKSEEGKIVAVLPPDPDAAADDSQVDIADAVAESVEVTMKGGEGTD